MEEIGKISVECYSGYRANESPRAFFFDGRRMNVLDVIGRWYEGGLKSDTPIMHFFKVRADDGMVYLLRYDPLRDEWTMLAPKRT
jgi:hypothetical protein